MAKIKRKKWNDIDKIILRLLQGCNSLTYEQIAKFLDKSIGSIVAQSSRMNLSRRKKWKKSDHPTDFQRKIKRHIKYCKRLKKKVLPSECLDCFQGSSELQNQYNNNRILCIENNLIP